MQRYSRITAQIDQLRGATLYSDEQPTIPQNGSHGMKPGATLHGHGRQIDITVFLGEQQPSSLSEIRLLLSELRP